MMDTLDADGGETELGQGAGEAERLDPRGGVTVPVEDDWVGRHDAARGILSGYRDHGRDHMAVVGVVPCRGVDVEVTLFAVEDVVVIEVLVHVEVSVHVEVLTGIEHAVLVEILVALVEVPISVEILALAVVVQEVGRIEPRLDHVGRVVIGTRQRLVLVGVEAECIVGVLLDQVDQTGPLLGRVCVDGVEVVGEVAGVTAALTTVGDIDDELGRILLGQIGQRPTTIQSLSDVAHVSSDRLGREGPGELDIFGVEAAVVHALGRSGEDVAETADGVDLIDVMDPGEGRLHRAPLFVHETVGEDHGVLVPLAQRHEGSNSNRIGLHLVEGHQPGVVGGDRHVPQGVGQHHVRALPRGDAVAPIVFAAIEIRDVQVAVEVRILGAVEATVAVEVLFGVEHAVAVRVALGCDDVAVVVHDVAFVGFTVVVAVAAEVELTVAVEILIGGVEEQVARVAARIVVVVAIPILEVGREVALAELERHGHTEVGRVGVDVDHVDGVIGEVEVVTHVSAQDIAHVQELFFRVDGIVRLIIGVFVFLTSLETYCEGAVGAPAVEGVHPLPNAALEVGGSEHAGVDPSTRGRATIGPRGDVVGEGHLGQRQGEEVEDDHRPAVATGLPLPSWGVDSITTHHGRGQEEAERRKR